MTRRAFYLALILIAALYAFAAFVFVGAAHAAMYACVGAQIDPAYVKQFDGVRGQLVDGHVRYPEKRWYREKQEWATRHGEAPGHHSEHLHMGACFPNGVTWESPNAERYVDVKYTFHNMNNYDVFSLGGSFVAFGRSTGAFEPADATAAVAALEPVMDASAGGATTVAYRTLRLRPATTNGLKELRWNLTVVETPGTTALFDRWQMDGRSYATDAYPGLGDPVEPIAENVRFVRNRTVVDFVDHNGEPKQDYHHAGWQEIEGVRTYQLGHANVSTPVGATLTGTARITDGGGPAAIEIDPNHHVHPDNRGSVTPIDFMGFSSSGTNFQRPFEIPTAGIPGVPAMGKWHKLVLLSHDVPECQRLNRVCPVGVRNTWTNVEVFPFKVS